MSSTYSITITGIKADVARETALKQLAKLLGVSEEKVVSILNSQKFVVKSGVDLATAAEYEAALQKAGGNIVVQPDATGTKDLIFDIPESLKRDNCAAKKVPLINQKLLSQLNPDLLKAVAFSSIPYVLGITVFVVTFATLNPGISAFFTGGNSVALASGIIKQSLKSPSSFSLVSGKEMWEGETADGKSAYIVEVEYDAQNGFGTSLRDCKVVAFYKDGDSVMWSSLWGSMPCASNPAHGGLLEHSNVVEIIREKNSFK